MKLQCPICEYPIEIDHPREGKVVSCDECKKKLKLIKDESWSLTVFERKKKERFL
ncbi:MAG: hypothetical protein U9N35_01165 [Euryarchaeota archaeon]|nr:hypothetical protein [Euryarchaeota archaeon]